MKEAQVYGQFEVRYDYLVDRGDGDPDIIENLEGPDKENFRFTVPNTICLSYKNMMMNLWGKV